jgi:hypothetical protein
LRAAEKTAPLLSWDLRVFPPLLLLRKAVTPSAETANRRIAFQKIITRRGPFA